jgi:hypothetical protein
MGLSSGNAEIASLIDDRLVDECVLFLVARTSASCKNDRRESAKSTGVWTNFTRVAASA